MVPDASFDSGQRSLPATDFGIVIKFDEMARDDRILIRTLNSEYRFSVTDPDAHRGMLSGGALGETPREAVLIESVDRGASGPLEDRRGLKTGSRALFYLSIGDRVERVTTSRISSLTLIKAAPRPSSVS